MSNMIIGEYEFPKNPSSVSGIIGAKKRCTYVLTTTGVSFFSWGMFAAGVPFTLNWKAMSLSMYDTLYAKLSAEVAEYFNPQDGSGLKYKIELIDLDGEYHFKLSSGVRRKVALQCVIIEEPVAV